MMSDVAKKTAGEFFGAVDDVLTGHSTSSEQASEGGGTASGAQPSAPGTFVAPPSARPPEPGFAVGVTVGAIAALAGAVIGGLLSRRRT
jgi:uncharacterized protein